MWCSSYVEHSFCFFLLKLIGEDPCKSVAEFGLTTSHKSLFLYDFPITALFLRLCTGNVSYLQQNKDRGGRGGILFKPARQGYTVSSWSQPTQDSHADRAPVLQRLLAAQVRRHRDRR